MNAGKKHEPFAVLSLQDLPVAALGGLSSGKLCDRDVVLGAEMGRVAVEPYFLAHRAEDLPCMGVQLFEGLHSLVDAGTYGSDYLHLIFAEISCDMRVITEWVRGLCEPAEGVHTESLTLNAEESGIIQHKNTS